MRSSIPSRKVVAALAFLLWAAPGGVWAQAKQPAKGGPKAEKKEAVTEARAVPAARRDPFQPLVSRQRPGQELPAQLPPGKAGLIIASLRVDGLVSGPNGMIAVVSTPQQRVYFLRDNDKLYDGSVTRITMEGVTFRETGKDAFGKPVDRQVVKRLYPSAGEQ